MQRLCLGHNRVLQDFLRVQRLNRLSVNLLLEVLPTLQEMINLLKKSFDSRQFVMAFGVIDTFDMLAVCP